jgi:8-oxo-dGTP pyrophosphatase MutT (NUDIX family)
MSLKPWKIISSKIEKSYSIFDLYTDQVRSPRTGKDYDFYVMKSPEWVNVIPITPEDEVVLIRQYRQGIREITLEIPGGLVDQGDTPLTAAIRELYEETGYRQEEIVPLESVYPNPAIQNNRCYTFLARNVVYSGSRELGDREDIEVVLRPKEEIPYLIRSGAITHALVIAAFYRYYMEYLPGLSK